MSNNKLQQSNNLQTASEIPPGAPSQNLKDKILDVLKDVYERHTEGGITQPGATDRQLMGKFSKPRNVISSARNALYREGKILKAAKVVHDGKTLQTWRYNPCEPKPLQLLTPGQKLKVIKQILDAPVDSALKTMDIEKVLKDEFFTSELQSLVE